MTKLSDTQRVILSRAAQHDALLATPPANLPAAARQAVLRSMITKGLLEEAPAPREAIALGWRQDEDGAWIALRITAAGLAAIGVEPDVPTSPQAVDDDDTLGERAPPPPVPAPSTNLPTAPQGDSLAAFPNAPPSGGGEAPEGPQRPAVSQHGPIGRAAALRTAATTVLTAWDAPDRDGLDEAMAALREALAASPCMCVGRTGRWPPARPPSRSSGSNSPGSLGRGGSRPPPPCFLSSRLAIAPSCGSDASGAGDAMRPQGGARAAAPLGCPLASHRGGRCASAAWTAS